MISYLIGKPQDVTLQRCTIVTNGVGYDVQIGPETSRNLFGKEQAELFISTVVREDDFSLYGFLLKQQKDVFLLLTSVSGVGPKTALNIVDFGAEHIAKAVQEADVSFFSAVPRVGKKLAQKIIIELKSKLGSLKDLDLTPQTSAQLELSEALYSLGFKEYDVQSILPELDLESTHVDIALKKALQLLGQRQVSKK